MPIIRADITPEVLAWTRNRALLDEEGAARKMSVSPDRYRLFEAGEEKPTLRQVQRFAKALNRPLGFFFLEAPPEEREIWRELRQLADAPPVESANLVATVRKATQRRQAALELYRALAQEPPSFPLTIEPGQNPDEVSHLVRSILQVELNDQFAWHSSSEALKQWREALQNQGVLVFQIPRMSIQEMRGFSIAVRPLPVIAFNSSDSENGRIFTVMHELAHILLGESYLDVENAGTAKYSGQNEVETYCNKVAAAILVPTGSLLENDVVVQGRQTGIWDNDMMATLARNFRVSKSVIVRRLRKLELIDYDLFEDLRREYDAWVKPSRSGTGGNHFNNKIAWIGTLIPRLALEAYGNGRVTSTEVASILESKVKHLGELEKRVRGYNLLFGE